MEEFNADNIFGPSHYFAQDSALGPDPTNEIASSSHLTSNTSRSTASHPSVALYNNSPSILPGLDVHSNDLIDSFNLSTGMMYITLIIY